MRFFSLPNRLVSVLPFGASIAKAEATTTLHIEGVFCIFPVGSRNNETVFIVGNRHVAVHFLYLGGRQADLVQHRLG